jgi:hypothetical protein
MAVNRTHFEDFDLSGYWWLPGEENTGRVAGTLTFSNQTSIKLELDGNFPEAPGIDTGFNEPFNTEIIYGFSSKGEPYTLMKAWRSNQNLRFPGYSTSTYEALYLIIGQHAGSYHRKQFRNILIRLTGLERSTAFSWFEHDSPDASTVKLTWKKPREFRIWVPVMRAHVGTHFTTEGQGLSDLQLTAAHKAFVKVAPRTQISLEWAWPVILRVQNLFTLLHGMPCCPLEVQFEVDENKFLNLFFVQDKSNVPRDPPLSDLLVPILSLTKRQREEAFLSWFRTRKPVRAAAELFAGTLFQKGIYTRLEFVNHVQTLEAFHRAVHRKCGKYMTTSEFEPVREALCDAIPKTVTVAHRSKLVNMVKHGYEYSQRKRFSELIDSLPSAVRQFIATRPADFVNKLVDTRNRYTHYDPTDKNAIFDDTEMAVCNCGLRLLLLFLFLRYIKIPGPIVFRGIERLAEWRIYSQLRTW